MNTNNYKSMWKAFWHHENVCFVLKNLLVALIIVIVAIIAVLIWLRSYTEHGVEIEVPNITGMYIEEARPIVEEQGFNLTVIDSTFSSKVPYGTIVEQNPMAGRKAKHGRNIYLIINAKAARRVALPELHDNSYRQAETTLAALNIHIKEVVYEPSEYKDIVLDVLQNDRSIEAGTRLAEGSSVTLVIGMGRGTEMVTVPNLKGLSLMDARSLLLSEYLTLGVIEYDEQPTAETQERYIVYSQDPAAGVSILEGSGIDVRMSANAEKAAISAADEHRDDEDFF